MITHLVTLRFCQNSQLLYNHADAQNIVKVIMAHQYCETAKTLCTSSDEIWWTHSGNAPVHEINCT